jgi:hypothetical protein
MQAAVVVREFHLGCRHIRDVTGTGYERDLIDELADIASLEMRIPEDRAADSSRRAGPCLHTSQAVRDRPPHKPVDRHPCVGTDTPLVDPLDLATVHTDHQTTKALVGNQHVGTTAQKRDRQSGITCQKNGSPQLVGVFNSQKVFGGPTDLERRECRERSVSLQSIAELRAQRSERISH